MYSVLVQSTVDTYCVQIDTLNLYELVAQSGSVAGWISSSFFSFLLCCHESGFSYCMNNTSTYGVLGPPYLLWTYMRSPPSECGFSVESHLPLAEARARLRDSVISIILKCNGGMTVHIRIRIRGQGRDQDLCQCQWQWQYQDRYQYRYQHCQYQRQYQMT